MQVLHAPDSNLRKVAVSKNTVVRSKSYNVPMLTPVVEYDADASAGGGVSCARRHSVSEMTSCLEESSPPGESGRSAAATGSLVQHFPASATCGGRTGGWERLFWRSTVKWSKALFMRKTRGH